MSSKNRIKTEIFKLSLFFKSNIVQLQMFRKTCKAFIYSYTLVISLKVLEGRLSSNVKN